MDDFEVAIDTVATTECELGDLNWEHTYWFRIVAYNHAGKSPPSQPSKAAVILRTPETSSMISSFDEQCNLIGSEDDFHRCYKVSEVLGKGRFSSVKHVHCNTTDTEYAIKVGRLFDTDDRSHDLEEEFTLLKCLKHNRIVQAFEMYRGKYENIVVLERIPGPPVIDFVCHLGYYSEGVCNLVISQILDALCFLHARGIIHGDIKPENILADPSGFQLRFVLIDFGNAIQQFQQKIVAVTGSLEYVAPELLVQCSTTAEDSGYSTTACDTWSVGCLLFSLLTGSAAFLEEITEETMRNILKGDFHFTRESRKRVSVYSRRFVRDLLVVNAKRRPTALQCLQMEWITRKCDSDILWGVDKLEEYLERRKLERYKTETGIEEQQNH